MKGECFIYHISTKLKQNDHPLTNYCHCSSRTPPPPPPPPKCISALRKYVRKPLRNNPKSMISGPSWMQILVSCSIGWPIMYASHRSTKSYFSANLQPIEQESVMLTGTFGDTLPLLGHFQNCRHKKKWKAKNGIFHTPTSNYHRYTNFITKYMFLMCKIWSNYSKIISWSSKGSKSKMAANFGLKIVLDIKWTSGLFLMMP